MHCLNLKVHPEEQVAVEDVAVEDVAAVADLRVEDNRARMICPQQLP
jgi:hypothetical protein